MGRTRTSGVGGPWRRALLLTAALLAGAAGSAAADDDLLELSLEDLMNVEVTSASKKAESKNRTAAAITVITAEDIRRSGFTSVPEALRMVPGLQVARIDASRWAISIRGFRQEFSNKLLVMIDGRSLYTPLFGGVVWAEQNFAIEDIERIEVVRGPGGTLWGANAVNGVINIISKKAAQTQGVRAHLFGGTQEAGLAGRYGGKIGEKTQYRVSAKGEKTFDYDFNQNYNGNDGWNQLRIGGRSDTQVDDRSELTVLWDYFDHDYERAAGVTSPAPPFPVVGFDAMKAGSRGGDVQAQYRHAFAGGSRLSLAGYYDTVARRITSQELSQTIDLQAQHELKVSPCLNLVYGAEYRYWTTHVNDPVGTLFYSPNKDRFHLGDAFVQVEAPLFDERLKLIAGTKLTVNNRSGFEYQPSGRVVLTPIDGHTTWVAASRAVRLPTFTDRDLTGTFVPGISLTGDRDFRSEELFSLEWGYRFYALERFTAELSTFYSWYEDLSSLVLTTPPIPPFGPLNFENGGKAQVRGGELELGFQPLPWLRVIASYSLLDFDEKIPALALVSVPLKRTDPQNQFMIRSIADLPSNFELDTALYFVDGLQGITPTLRSDNVRQYFRFDLRVGWKPLDWLEVSLVGQNLLDPRHAEFYDVQRNQSTQVPRSGYAKITVQF